MRDIEDRSEVYGSDPASSVVAYFFLNAKDWKTETAGKVKEALQNIVNKYNEEA